MNIIRIFLLLITYCWRLYISRSINNWVKPAIVLGNRLDDIYIHTILSNQLADLNKIE